jgi:phenylalanyl-tRNA synthetase beta chain
MPTIEVNKKELARLCGLNEDQLREVLEFVKAPVDEEEEDSWKLEITPDRPDMFSVEGVARVIKGFLGRETGMPLYRVEESDVVVKVEEVEARPYIACALIKNVKLDDELIRSLMQLQEKLHITIGRNRKKVAIGVHDFDKVEPPFTYKEVDPARKKFVPLGMQEELSLKEILEKHEKGREYAWCLQGFKRYPIIVDKNNNVLSFPPIINGELTRVTEYTKNLFIDVTGSDKFAVEKTLNILVCNIAERGGIIYKVKVGDNWYPNLEPEERKLSVSEVNKLLGLDLNESEIAKILERMRYSVMPMKGGILDVLIPPYRVDILHQVDLIEDVAIGYGINNIIPVVPKIATVGKLLPKEKFCSKLRELLIGLGFQEVLTFILTSKEKQFAKMCVEEGLCVELENPVSSEFTICRKWLLPNLLKFLSANTHRGYPEEVFEIGDCLETDEKGETKTRVTKKLAGAICYDLANLTEIKAIVEAIARNLGKKLIIKPLEHPSFIETRCGEIYLDGEPCGFFGEIHPKVLENWKLAKPVVAFEIELDKIFGKF